MTFYEKTRAARKVLVVDLAFLGDTVHLVPALWELKRQYPGAELHVVSAPVGAEVLRLAPCVDRAWPLVLDPKQRTLREQWRLMRALRREKFDVAFNFAGVDRTTILTWLSGARWRLGHAGGRPHLWNAWLIPDWVARRPSNLPVFEQKRQVLAAAGFTLQPPRWDLQLPPASIARAAEFLPLGSVHFSINASTPLKEWPLDCWIELARHWLADDAGLRIVATGSGSTREQERLQAFAAGVANDRLRILPPGLAIADLAAVLRRCRLHMGADSGVLHLAMAVGTPTLSLFRDYHDAGAWMPVGPAHRVLTAACECVNRRDPPCGIAGRAKCLAGLAPDAVEHAAKTLLGSESSFKAPPPM
jgi:ADP-heptose:LPS heptosyltransferase